MSRWANLALLMNATQNQAFQTERFLQNVIMTGGAKVERLPLDRIDARYTANRDTLCVQKTYINCINDKSFEQRILDSGLSRCP
jgi:hypothetical protein